LALITLAAALDAAREGNYGVGAFNVTDLAQAEAVLDAATQTDSPVIIQTIAGSSAHGRDELFWEALVNLIANYPDIPVVMHLDHGASYGDCVRAIAAGFTSVMIDGSMRDDHVTPATFGENVAVTRRVVDYAHEHGVSVEGELGTIGGSEDGGASSKEIVLADPDEAERFVAQTGVDALAVAIGTSHGAYKFTSPPDGTVLRMDLIEEIAKRVPETHLVMHGSSSLPGELRGVINAHGGRLPESWGVPETEKARSTKLGIRKINQGMDSHMAYTAAVRTYLDEDGIGCDPALYGSRGRVAMQQMVADRMDVFGQTGQAHRHR
jgi:fructose-bisphosphate aldolase class II